MFCPYLKPFLSQDGHKSRLPDFADGVMRNKAGISKAKNQTKTDENQKMTTWSSRQKMRGGFHINGQTSDFHADM